MKKLLPLLMLVLILFSCAKEGEVELQKDPSKYNFYPQSSESRIFKDTQENDFSLIRSSSNSLYDLDRIGYVTTNKSYIYAQTSASSSGYLEYIDVKNNSLESVIFQIKEEHRQIISGSYTYKINFTPYNLEVLKKGIKLSDTWSNSQDITISYIGNYNSAPLIADETVTIQFNYVVSGFKESLKAYKDYNNSYSDPVTFDNVATITVSYTLLGETHIRKYSFSSDFGLVSMSIDNNSFLIEKNKN